MKLAVVGLLASLVASAYASHRAPPRPAAMHAHAVGPNARRFAAGLPPLAPLRGKRELRGQMYRRQNGPSAALPMRTQTPAEDLSQKSGFQSTCTDVTFDFNSAQLAATCALNAGGNSQDSVTSTLNLNLCTANDNGVLIARDRGFGLSTCNFCTLNGNELSCSCEQPDGNDGASFLDLTQIVSNNDGVLQCYGSFGQITTGSTETSPPPPGQTQPPARDLSVKSGFDRTCDRESYTFNADENRFAASCVSGPNDDNVASTLDLNACLANANGQLVGRDRGNGLSTCRDCSVDITVLQCDCRDEANDLITSAIDLDTIVGNRQGILQCYGTFANVV